MTTFSSSAPSLLDSSHIRSRKPRPLSYSLARLGSAATVVAVLGMAAASHAATFYWDPTADGDGLLGGTGTWSTAPANLFWDLTGTDPVGADNVAWPNLADSIAVFQGAAGTVTINNGGAGVIANGLTFNTTGYNIVSSIPADVLTLAGATPTIGVTAAGDTATIGSIIAGTTGFTKIGAGTLVLGGTNIYSGPTAINAGQLSISNTANLGDGSATNVLAFAGGTLRTTATLDLGASRAIVLNPGGGIVSVANATALTASGNLSGNGALGVTGTGTAVLSGDNSGYTGNVTVDSNNGLTTAITTLRLVSNNALTSGVVTLNPSTTVVGGTGTILEINGAAIGSGVSLVMNSNSTGSSRRTSLFGTGGGSFAGPIQVNGTDIVAIQATGVFTVSSDITAGGGFTGTLTLRGAGGTGTFTGSIITPTALNKTDNSTWTLTPNATGLSYSQIAVQDGTIKLGKNDALPTDKAMILNQGTGSTPTFDLNSFNQTLPSLTVAAASTGASRVINSGAGTPTLTINTAADSTFGLSATIGILGGAGANSFALSKMGTATLFLTGTNTFAGGTTISAGKISTNNGSGLGTGPVSIPTGGTLETTAAVTVANAITLSGGTLTSTGFQLTLGAGGLTFAADSTVNTTTGPTASKVLAGANLLTGAVGTTISKIGAGDFQINGAQPNLHSNWNVSAGYLELQNATAAGDGVVTVSGTGEVVNSNVNVGNAITLNTGTTISANSGANGIYSGPITLAGDAVAGLRFFQTVTTANSFTINGDVSGPGGLTVNSGSSTTQGTLTLSGTNSFAGVTGITNANVRYSSSAAIAGAGANVTVNANGAAAAGYAIDQAFLGRIVNTSVGAVALGGVNSSNNLDFSAAGANFTAASLGATGAASYTGTLTPNGTTYRLGGGGGTLTLPNANALTGANDLVVQNVGTVVLANTNDLTGTTTVNSGTLVLAADNALVSSNITVAGGTLQIGAGGLTGSIGTGTLAVNGTLTLNRGDRAYTFAAPLTGTGTIVQAANGKINITGGNIPRLQFSNNGAVDVQNVATTLGVDGGVLLQVTGGVYGEVNASTGGSLLLTPNNGDVGAVAGATLVINAPIADGTGSALDFFNAGIGTVILNGANTYTGATNIQSGVVVASLLNKVTGGSASSSLGAPTTVGNGTINVGGSNTSTLRYVGTGETTDRVINLAGTTAGAILEQSGSGVLGFSSNFTATGAGIKTLTLTGYGAGSGLISGAIVNSASATNLTKTGPVAWSLNGANTYTGVTTLAGGTLTLDFANATPTANILAATSTLTTGAGTLALTGKASTTNSQTVASTTVALGGSAISLTANATANPLVLNLGAITRNAGGVVNFTLPTGTQSATNGVTTSTGNGAGGILGGYATVGGTDWATKSGTNIIALAAGSYTAMPTTGGTITVNYALSGASTLTGATTFNSLKITDTAAAQALALGANAMTFSGTAGGLLYAGGTSNAYTISGTGVIGAGTANEFIVNTNTGASLTISAPLVSSTATAGSLTKSGAGTLTPTAVSAFTGSINLTGGVLAASLTNTATTVLGGQLGTTFRMMNFTNGATFRATNTYNDNGPSATNTGFVFNFGAGGGTLDVGSGFTLTLDDGSGAGVASTNAELQGSGDLTKIGVGTLSLGNGTSNFSNFAGRIFVNAGTLTFGGTSGGVNPLGSVAAGTFVASGAGINLNGGTNAAAEPLTLNGTGTASLGALTNGSATNASFAGLITLASDTSIGGSSGGAITLNAPLIGTGKLTKVGTNLLTLGGGNTYTGGTAVSAGSLVLSRLSAVPTTGAFTVAAGATLGLNVGGNGEFQNSDVATQLANTTFANNTSVLSLDTTNALGGTFTSAAVTGAVGFAKTGTGTLILPVSTYTGATVVAAGTLQTSADNGLPATALTLGANLSTVGTLDLNGFNQSFASVSTALNSGTAANVITVANNRTLTVNGNVSIGPVATVANQTSRLNIGGGGDLIVATAAGGTVRVGGNTTSAFSEAATLDLTGLNSASINVSATGTIGVGNTTGTNVVGNTGTLLLPTPAVASGTAVTTLAANNFNIGDGGGNNAGAGQINSAVLGTGLTTINANNVNIGTGGRDVGSLTIAAGNGTVVLRNAAGTGRAAFSVGGSSGVTGVNNGAGVTGNLADFTGHSSDLLISSLTIGNQGRTATQNYDFKFDAGTLDATSVAVGNDTVGSATNVPGIAGTTLTSTLQIGGGNVTVGSGGVSMGTVSGTRGGSTSAATAIADVGNFNITGGTVNIGTTGAFSIQLANLTSANAFVSTSDSFSVTGGTVTLAGAITSASTTRTTTSVTLDGGTLDLTGHAIGGLTAITNLNFRSGTLSNVASINNGTGLAKTGPGTLILAGTNSYPGPTSVTDGRLLVNGSISGSAATVSGATATLGGSGTVLSVAADTGGTVAPGNSPGVLTVASTFSLDSTSHLAIEISAPGVAGVTYDQLSVGGAISLGGASLDVASTFAGGNTQDIFTIILNNSGSAVTGTFAGLANAGIVSAPNGQMYQISYFDDPSTPTVFETSGGNSVALLAVPEPNAFAMLLASVGVALGLNRFRRRVA